MFILDILRIILGFIFVLFIPGYALTWAIFPKKEDKEFIERIAFSFVLSIISVMLSVLFIDVILGVDTTTWNISVTIILITLFASILWKIETIYLNNDSYPRIKKLKSKISYTYQESILFKLTSNILQKKENKQNPQKNPPEDINDQYDNRQDN